MNDGFNDQPNGGVTQERDDARETPKPKRPKKRPTKRNARTLPDLSELPVLFGCMHAIDGDCKYEWDKAFERMEASGLSIIMEGNDIKGILLPYEAYNDLVARSEGTLR